MRKGIPFIVVSVALMILVGCPFPGTGDAALYVGSFIDGPVQGLRYETSSGIAGITDASGNFEYAAGDTVEFFIAGQRIGIGVPGDAVLTPLDLFGATTINGSSMASRSANNLVRLLMALDTGENPYGLTLPDNIHADYPSGTNLNALLLQNGDAFIIPVRTLISTITGEDPASITIPTAAEAIGHFNLSMELVNGIETGNSDDNVFLTIHLPPGRTGSVSFSYMIETLPPGIFRYTSGQTRPVDTDTDSVTFSERMYEGDWQFTISHIADEAGVAVGDILSFYETDGFGTILPAGYPFEKTADRTVLLADLNTSGAVVSEVRSVSGTIRIPALLVDGVTDAKDASFQDLVIFVAIQSTSGDDVAIFAVRPDLPDPATWVSVDDVVVYPGGVPTIVDGYEIDYSTTLPAGHRYRTQTYMRFDDSDLISHAAISGILTADLPDHDFAESVWETID